MKVRVQKDSSAKKRSRSWYILDTDAKFTSDSYIGITENMSRSEVEKVTKHLKALGVEVHNEWF